MEENIEIKIKIKKSLYEQILKEAERSGFNSLDEFFEFILEQLVESEGAEEASLSEEEEEKVRERLRALGYID